MAENKDKIVATEKSREQCLMSFVVFLIHILSKAWHKLPSNVYAILKESGVLSRYIIPSYDVLQTLGARYLADDITGCVRDWGYEI